MPVGYIDTATLGGITQTLSHDRMEDCYQWAWQTALSTTISLIGPTNLGMAPSPVDSTAAAGLFGVLLSKVRAVTEQVPIIHDSPAAAQAKTIEWATSNSKKLDKLSDELIKNADYHSWFNYSIMDDLGWMEHAGRYNGILDAPYLPVIAPMIGLTVEELGELNAMSRLKDTILRYRSEHLSRNTTAGDFQLTKKAFTVCAQLRGVYHDYLAKENKLQIIHHPMRITALPQENEGRQVMHGTLSKADFYLASIIVAGCFSEKDKTKRIDRWFKNMMLVRNGYRTNATVLKHDASDEESLTFAITYAQNLELETPNDIILICAEILFNIGLAAALHCFLTEWPELVLGGIVHGVAIRKLGVPDRVGKSVANSDHILHKLALAGPGRVNLLEIAETHRLPTALGDEG